MGWIQMTLQKNTIASLLFDKKMKGKSDTVLFPIHQIVFSDNLAEEFKEHIVNLGIGQKYALICDRNTYAVIGEKVMQACQGMHMHCLILEGDVKANEDIVEQIRKVTQADEVIIAVGSGTINDLCKYASYLDKKPYIVIGTAPSMNGYSSANAAITIMGYKKSIQAQLPCAIFFDMNVLVHAPIRLIKSGLGDALSRSTAQVDWLLSHYLLKTPYDDRPFEWLKQDEDQLFSCCEGLVKRDRESIKLLMRTLVVSGLGMYLCQGSYPASQGEHMIAHTLDMKIGAVNNYHGEQVGVTTLTMALLQEKMLASQAVAVCCNEIPYKELVQYFGEKIARLCWQAYKKKQDKWRKIKENNQNFSKNWVSIAEMIKSAMVPETTLRQVLKKIDAPTEAWHIGYNNQQYTKAVHLARYTRERFTFLDLVHR